MMGESKPETRELFTAAWSLKTPEERARYLDEVCRGKPELRQRVEALLRAHDQAGGFLEQTIRIPPSSDLQVEHTGVMIGRYKLLQEIGEGGFGQVFMAEQKEPVQRKVALKIVKAGMDTKEVIARFEAERQALALMDHPNIARVLDAGATEAGRPYFVMELVRGIPITEYCDRNNLPMTGRLELFMQVCQAVQHAHQKAIIHRDLKPTNILVTMIDGKPVPKIIDFGVAKALGQKLTEKTLFTAFEQIIGTPAYMSPEQAALSGVDVDTRSDIYSLGVLLYELLTGVTPFDGETLRKAALDEIRRMIRETEPPKPSTRLQALVAADVRRLKKTGDRQLAEEEVGASSRRLLQIKETIRLVHGDLDWIVMKALEKDRKRRYETAGALVEDLQRHLDHQPVQAGPPGAIYRTRKFVRRHRVGVALDASLIATLLAGLVVSLVGFSEAQRERDHALLAESLAQEQSSLASQNLYRAHIRVAGQDWESGQLGRMVQTLQQHISKPGEQDRRGWEWYYLWSLCHNAKRELGPLPGPVSSLALHPNGQWLASSTGSQITIWDMDSGRQIAELSGHTNTVNSVAWSPDGTRLASCGWDRKVILWDTNRFCRLREFDCGEYVWEVRWNPDGSQVAASQSGTGPGGNGGVVTIWDATSGVKLHRLAGNVGIIWTLAWQPQGKLLVTGENYKGRIQVWNSTDEKLVTTINRAHRHLITSVRWSPDGRRLASASRDQTIRIRAADTWEILLEINPAHDGVVTCLLWSGDGRTLTSGGEDGLLKTWDSSSGALLHVLRAHSGGVNAVCWSRDGQFLISGGGDPVVRCWSPDEEQSARVVAGAWRCAWSPDERYLATGSAWDNNNPAGVLVLDTATWQTSYRLPYPTNRAPHSVSSISWSPDGRKLATGFFGSVVQVWDMSDRKLIWSWQGDSDSEGARTVAWSPDSRLLALSSFWEAVVRIWNAETGKLIRTFRGHSNSVFSAVWHPDGKRIASKDMGGHLLIWDATSGEVLQRLYCPGGTAGNQGVVNWNPGGTLLAAGCGNGSIRIWDVQTGKLVRELKRHSGNVRSVCWSPDGRRLVSGAEDRTIRLWDTETGQEVMSLPHPNVWLPFVSWSPSGRMIVVCSEQVQVYDASIGYKLASTPPTAIHCSTRATAR